MFFGHLRAWGGYGLPRLSTIVILTYIFLTRYFVPQIEIVYKICSPRKLAYQLTTSRSIILLVLHLLGLGFCISRFFPLKD
jgi:hypothetical protein